MMGEQVLGLLEGKLHEAKARAEDRINIKDELELLEVCARVTDLTCVTKRKKGLVAWPDGE